MSASTRCRAAILASLLVAACGEAPEGTGRMEHLGKQLDQAGAKAGAEMDKALAAAKEQLQVTGTAIEKIAAEAKKSAMLKGDALAAALDQRLPEIEQQFALLKQHATAAGGTVKAKLPELEQQLDAFRARLSELAAAGADASVELKQATVQSLAKLGSELKGVLSAMAK